MYIFWVVWENAVSAPGNRRRKLLECSLVDWKSKFPIQLMDLNRTTWGHQKCQIIGRREEQAGFWCGYSNAWNPDLRILNGDRKCIWLVHLPIPTPRKNRGDSNLCSYVLKSMLLEHRGQHRSGSSISRGHSPIRDSHMLRLQLSCTCQLNCGSVVSNGRTWGANVGSARNRWPGHVLAGVPPR